MGNSQRELGHNLVGGHSLAINGQNHLIGSQAVCGHGNTRDSIDGRSTVSQLSSVGTIDRGAHAVVQVGHDDLLNLVILSASAASDNDLQSGTGNGGGSGELGVVSTGSGVVLEVLLDEQVGDLAVLHGEGSDVGVRVADRLDEL